MACLSYAQKGLSIITRICTRHIIPESFFHEHGLFLHNGLMAATLILYLGLCCLKKYHHFFCIKVATAVRPFKPPDKILNRFQFLVKVDCLYHV